MSNKGKTKSGNLESSRIKALLFDVDGTLSDTDDHMVTRVAKALNPVSWLFKDRNPKRFARRFVMGVETPGNFFYNLADRLGIDAYIAKYYRWISKKRFGTKLTKDRFWLIPGVREMLEILAKCYPLGVVSARDSASSLEFLDFFNLKSYFQVVVTSQTCQHTKPFPDPVIYAAEVLGVDPDACVMVGDTVVDIRSGNSAGAQSVGVLCGFGTEKELRRVGADLILSSTPEIIDYLNC